MSTFSNATKTSVATFVNQTLHTATWADQSKSTIDTSFHFLIDASHRFLIDNTFFLNIGGSNNDYPAWTNQSHS